MRKKSFVAKNPLFSLNSFIIAKKNHKNKRNRVGKVGFWPLNVKTFNILEEFFLIFTFQRFRAEKKKKDLRRDLPFETRLNVDLIADFLDVHIEIYAC